jgi:ribosomal protein S14
MDKYTLKTYKTKNEYCYSFSSFQETFKLSLFFCDELQLFYSISSFSDGKEHLQINYGRNLTVCNFQIKKRNIYHKFRISRYKFRALILKGIIPGFKRAS